MQYIVTMLLMLAGVIKKDSKLLFICILSWLWVLFAFNLSNADYTNYELFYYRYGALGTWDTNMEIGYQLICKLSNIIGLDYQAYLAMISLFGLGIIGYTIRKFTRNYSFALVLYMIYPFILDIVQQRNFLAIVFIVFGFQFLMSSKKIASLYYIICVLLAMSFHYFSFFYLLFIVTRWFNINKIIKFCTIAFVALFIFALFPNIFWNALVQIPFMLSSAGKIEVWQSIQTVSNVRGYIYSAIEFVLRLFIIGLSHYTCIRLSKNSKENGIQNINARQSRETLRNLSNLTKISELVFKINIISVLIFPMLMIYSEVGRAIRTVMILNYILFAAMLEKEVKWRGNSRYLYTFIIVMYVLFVFMLQIYWPFYDTVFNPVFEYNSLFK